MLLFSLLSLLKYEKKKTNQKLKFFVIVSFILPLPEVLFCIYCIVSLGILVVSLRAASSLCSGTDSATTCTNRNHITRCTASKIEPLEPINISSHFFATAVWWGNFISWECHFFGHFLALLCVHELLHWLVTWASAITGTHFLVEINYFGGLTA